MLANVNIETAVRAKCPAIVVPYMAEFEVRSLGSEDYTKRPCRADIRLGSSSIIWRVEVAVAQLETGRPLLGQAVALTSQVDE